MSNQLVNLTTTVSLVANLRALANYIELVGPDAYKDGSLSIQAITEVDHPSAYDRSIPTSLQVIADLQLRTPAFAVRGPSCGIRLQRAAGNGTIVRWDGESKRAPKKGEHFLKEVGGTCDVYKAKSDLKTKHWIAVSRSDNEAHILPPLLPYGSAN